MTTVHPAPAVPAAPAPPRLPGPPRPSGLRRPAAARTAATPQPGAAPAPAPVAPASLAPAPAAPGRDAFVDGVRAVGTLLVVALHWLMVEATWDGSRLAVGNALGHGAAWLLTWLQPLPLLFFAAGAAARYDLARRPGQAGWRLGGTRTVRMATPVGVFVAVWAALVAVLPRLGVPEAAVDRAARIVPQPLWFLGVQIALLALSPLLLRALRRWGAGVLVLAGAGALAVDALRFADAVGTPGWPNLLLVWGVPYGAGLLYAERRAAAAGDGTATGAGRAAARRSVRAGTAARAAATLVRVPAPRLRGRTALAVLTAGALAGTVALLALGPYPVSLIGMPGDAVSNLAPPTAPVVLFAVAQVGAALLVRDAVARWAARSSLVRWVGARSMGLYLWHLTAVFAVAGVVLLGAGRALPESWGSAWWVSRPVFLGVAAVVLVLLVAGAARVERVLGRSRRATRSRATAPARGAVRGY